MKLYSYIILITATIATLSELNTVNGYALWSQNVRMCLNEHMDLFCDGNFKDKPPTKRDVNPKPTNVRNVADECCKKSCTIKYIYDTYCVNRMIVLIFCICVAVVCFHLQRAIATTRRYTTTTLKPQKRRSGKSKSGTKKTTTPRIPSSRVITTTKLPDKLPDGLPQNATSIWWYPVGTGPWTLK